MSGALNPSAARNCLANPSSPPEVQASYRVRLLLRYQASSQLGGARCRRNQASVMAAAATYSTAKRPALESLKSPILTQGGLFNHLAPECNNSGMTRRH